MHDAGFDKQHVVRRKRVATPAVDEPTGAARDDIRLVACVRLLQVGATRRVQLDLERPVLEDGSRAFANRFRQVGGSR